MFKYLVWISALAVALCAAFFSVTGIATLFSGKFWSVMAMASSLEVGKLVAASFLYRYWKSTAGLLKMYMVIGVALLMAITSIGIYGYLSAAYAQVAAIPQNTMNQIASIESRQQSIDDDIVRLRTDNETITARQNQSQTLLDNILAGETSLSQRSAWNNLRTEIEELDAERQVNSDRIQLAQVEKDSLEQVRLQSNADLNTNSELGTFVYLARTLNVPLDTVVKWFALMIVFVFDPLAISLILAYNSIVMKERELESAETIEDPGIELVTHVVNKLVKKEILEEDVEVDPEFDESLSLNRLDVKDLHGPDIRYSRQGKDPDFL